MTVEFGQLQSVICVNLRYQTEIEPFTEQNPQHTQGPSSTDVTHSVVYGTVK